MNSLFTFVLGLLIGWLLEWLIDFFYWRRRSRVNEPTVIPATGDRVQSGDKAVLQPVLQPAAVVDPDDLKIIKGIGPVIERKLNDAGIRTFQQLGNLTAGDLRQILGNTIQRLADEEALLQQARDLAHRK